jgi:hypothetical protein
MIFSLTVVNTVQRKKLRQMFDFAFCDAVLLTNVSMLFNIEWGVPTLVLV